MKSPPVAGARVVVPCAEIEAACERLGSAVQQMVDDGNCVLLGVLLGGLLPLARLVRQLEGDFAFDTCRVARYGHGMTGGDLRWLARPEVDLHDRHVILVDDIFDEGLTLAALMHECRRAGARQTSSVVLVRKRHDRVLTAVRPDLVGVETDDEYLFGAGMDYQGRWRHLPDIWGLPSTA